MLLYEREIRSALDQKAINTRQYTILTQLLDRPSALPLDAMRQAPWYQALYLKLNDKTAQRDLRSLREQAWLHLDENNRLWPGFLRPARIKGVGRRDGR